MGEAARNRDGVRHLVAFTWEENILTVDRVTCLGTVGAPCRYGCPVPGCDWSHDEEGCRHCLGECECNCVHDGIPHRDCECETCVAHGDACPHRFQDMGECWLLPWVDNCDADWLYETPIKELLTADLPHWDEDVEEEPPPLSRWTVEFTGIDGVHDEGWWPDSPVMETRQQVKA